MKLGRTKHLHPVGRKLTGEGSLLFVRGMSLGNCIISLRPRQNGRHFADDTFKWFFQNENVWISIKISLKFVPKAPISNIPSLVQIMAWRRPGDNHYLNQWWLVYRRIYASLSLNELTHLPLDKVVVILQTIFSGVILWMKSFVFWLEFH